MITSLIYFILFSGLFYFIYKALFAGFNFFGANRLLLLLIPAVSLIIAFVAPAFTLPITTGPNTEALQLPTITITGLGFESNTASANQGLNWWVSIYLLGISLFTAYFLVGLFKLRIILKNAAQAENLENDIYLSEEVKGAFNFAHFIILPARLYHAKQYQTVLEHEQAHKRLKHYLDNFYFTLWTIATWFNPFIHLLGKELKQVHECQADAQVLKREKNIENYAHMLLSSTFGGDIAYPVRALSASPFFNSSLIKTRITMIYKNRTPKWRGLLYLTVLPLIAGMTLLACSKNESVQEKQVEQKILSIADVQELPLAKGCEDGLSREESMMCFQQALMAHISENFKYPEEARELGMEGRVYVEFVINSKGVVSEVQIKRGLTPDVKDEAGNPVKYSEAEKAASKATDDQVVALVQNMPDFEQPARQDDKPVAISFTLPIMFEIPPKTETPVN